MEQIIEQALILRGLTISYYKRYERSVLFIAKFLAGLYIFANINGVGLYHPLLDGLFAPPVGFLFLLFMALLFTVSPPTLSYFLITVQITMQLSQSLEVAAFVFLLLCLVIIFYARLSPQKSYLIIAIIIGFHLNIPYAVVIFAGLYIGVTAIIPVAVGTCISSSIPFFIQLVSELKTPDKIEIMDIPQNALDIFQAVFSALTGSYNWIIIAFIFTVVILGVYAVTLLTFDYAKEIAVAFGGAACIISLMMAALLLGDFQLSLLGIFFGSIFSVLLIGVIRFFDCVLDYRRTERVQFEDEDNFYYVKIIPKIAQLKMKPSETRTTAVKPRERYRYRSNIGE